jgi:hypothetical protein
MEASHGTEPRVIRLADAPEVIEFDPTDLLARLEAQAEEMERLSQVIALTEQQMQAIWTHLSIAERPLALPPVPLWRRLLRRPPRA